MATITETARRPQVRQTQCFIGGQWRPSAGGKTFTTFNPATEEPIADVADGDASDIEAAVKAVASNSTAASGREWMPGIGGVCCTSWPT
ncbi:MAG: hypothetical protein QM811_01020 [Pirellulales bacterium]